MPEQSVAIPASDTNEKELITLINEGYQMLHYIARHGELTIDHEITEGIQQARAKWGTRHWSMTDETLFLECYDRLTKQIYPVTLESIQAVDIKSRKGKKIVSGASLVISWYRRYTVITLICLLCVQMYYLFGMVLIQSLNKCDNETAALVEMNKDSVKEKQTQIESRRNASYQLLQTWNQVWLLGQGPSISATRQRHDVARKNSTPDPHLYNTTPYSASIIAAKTVLQMLQSYILPLLYGLLGAFIFVLRSLLMQIRSLTYTASREIGYRLRLTLGCLAGMIIGLILKPDDMKELSLSPMGFAFICGYSIEVLFTLLDRLIDQIRQKTSQNAQTSAEKKAPD